LKFGELKKDANQIQQSLRSPEIIQVLSDAVEKFARAYHYISGIPYRMKVRLGNRYS